MLNNVNKLVRKLETNKYNKIIEKAYKGLEKDENDKSYHLNILKDMKNENIDLEKALISISKLSQIYFGLTPYKSQLKAALVLNSGQIAELATGEGKTLSVVIAAILNNLQSKKTHVITANEYLIERDFNFSKELFEDLGITSWLISNNELSKKEIYTKDVLYGLSRNFVFDYLNNNKVYNKSDEFDEVYDCVIIDEVDFVLIDEARTPIVLSGAIESETEKYKMFEEISQNFKGSVKKRNIKQSLNEKLDEANGKPLEAEKGIDFVQSLSSLELTEEGYAKLEFELKSRGILTADESLYDGDGFSYISYLIKALKANHEIKENIDYIVIDSEIVPIDQQTGRPMRGRSFSGGLHQALEAKLGLEIRAESKNLAQTTLQNFLRKYNKISGTTGTASTEEIEFKEFYSLKVLPIAPNKASQRNDKEDLLFLGNKERNAAIIRKVIDNQELGRPTLIGTQTLEDSEKIASLLENEKINFNLLNAKNHEKEAFVVINAGKKGVVTIATNMAGRGTDIMLGGNKEEEIQRMISEEGLSEELSLSKWQKEHDEIVQAGGLSIIGVSRDTSRRLDNQLIGRAGRQGDPGETQFYLSLEDKIFETMSVDFLKSHWKKSDPNEGISFNFFSKIVKEVQKNLESMSFSQRKNLFKFDSINSEQRDIFYDWRKKIVALDSYEKIIEKYFKSVLLNSINSNIESLDLFANDLTGVEQDFEKILNQRIDLREMAKKNDLEDADDVVEFLVAILLESYKEKMSILNPEDKFNFEKEYLLKVMDDNYAENMSSLEQMRSSTGLRAYAQKNPLDEYQKEALEMFSNLVKNVKKDYMQHLLMFSPNLYLERQERMRALQEEIRKMEENGEEINIESLKQTTNREQPTNQNSQNQKSSQIDEMFGFIKGIGV